MTKANNLNQVAIWLPMKSDSLDIKIFDSYQYHNQGKIHSATSKNPVVRYAKNYTNAAGKFSLCLISTETDAKKMQTYLDKLAETIGVPIGKKFMLTEHYYA